MVGYINTQADDYTITYRLDSMGNICYNELDRYIDIDKTAFSMEVVSVKKGDRVQDGFILKNKQNQSTPVLSKMHFDDVPVQDAMGRVLCAIASAGNDEPSHVFVDLSTGAISEPVYYIDGCFIADTTGDLVSLKPDLTFSKSGMRYEHRVDFVWDVNHPRTSRITSREVVVSKSDANDTVYYVARGYRTSDDYQPELLFSRHFYNSHIYSSHIPCGAEDSRTHRAPTYDGIVEFVSDGGERVLVDKYTYSVIQNVFPGVEYDLAGCADFDEYYTKVLSSVLAEKKWEAKWFGEFGLANPKAKEREANINVGVKSHYSAVLSGGVDIISDKPTYTSRSHIREVSSFEDCGASMVDTGE